MSAMNSGDAFRRDTEEALGTAPAFRRGIAEMRNDVTLGLEAIERGVNGSNGDVAVNAGFNLAANGYAVSVVAEAKKSEEHNVLELAEEIAWRH